MWKKKNQAQETFHHRGQEGIDGQRKGRNERRRKTSDTEGRKEIGIKDNGQPPPPPLRLSHIHTERPGSLSV